VFMGLLPAVDRDVVPGFVFVTILKWDLIDSGLGTVLSSRCS
jgi:hypothetical protein